MTYAEGEEFAKEHNLPFIETSAKLSSQVDEVILFPFRIKTFLFENFKANKPSFS